MRAELAAGRVPTGAARVLAAWVCHLRGQGAPVADVAAEEFTALAAGELDDAVGRVLARLGADDARLAAAVTALARELAADRPGQLMATDCRRDGPDRLIDGQPRKQSFDEERTR